MKQKEESNERFWGEFHGPNIGYIEEQYDLYVVDPENVDASIRDLFERYGAPIWSDRDAMTEATSQGERSTADIRKITAATKYVEAIRRYGHINAKIYAIGDRQPKSETLGYETYGINEGDLQNIPASLVWEEAPRHLENALDVVHYLQDIYTNTISFEFDHISDDEEQQWLTNYVETKKHFANLSTDEKKELLERLVHVEEFEHFLHNTFIGQKRFSIEGLEMMVPILDHIVKNTATDRIDNIMMGMAHRGRLSVLAYILEKPMDTIFSEFDHAPGKKLRPTDSEKQEKYGWTGDVKYHFGGTREVKHGDHTTTIRMAHNPSHLEFVNPVVNGFTRASQDDRSAKGYPEQDVDKGFSVLIHGDAAFIGEGIVAETLNLSRLKGYQTGGTIHLIANNLLGYTTTQSEGRSTRYATDIAKGFEMPVVHVNADDPIACIAAAKLAYDYRRIFNKDVVIDLVGYRRYGHNEMDEPRATQPHLYQEIDEHPTIANIFFKQLVGENIISEEELETLRKDIEKELQEIYDQLEEHSDITIESKEMPEVLEESIDTVETTIPEDRLKKINAELLKRPEDFKGFRRLDRIFNRRVDALEDGNAADWGTGEALAFASILEDGTPIRLTGQDSERGTFAHRHLVLHDTESSKTYCPMHGLEDAKASFDIRNSPLSEAGVLGFEYGYSVYAPETLVIWEAQFGDFANAAQVIFDQFISAARAKWGDQSNMVMLLPHGYEGQGPEHSSARLERFLQMAAENNWIVAYVTSSAQLFHILRRQAAMQGKDTARPLILMTPKSSLLRSQRVASTVNEFTEQSFQRVVEQENLSEEAEKVERLILGTGKVMIDIEEQTEESGKDFSKIKGLRLEQIYPFPEEEIREMIKELPNLKEVVWVQEEPKNMGSWNFVHEHLLELLGENISLRYIGRPARSSPAVGEPNIHKVLQDQIIKEAINLA